MTNVQLIFDKIDAYKKRYYQNLLIKGTLFALAVLLTAFLLFNTLEYFGRFNSLIRATFLFSFLGLLAYAIFFWIAKPLLHLFNLRQPLSHEQAAQDIGRFFPDIKDKLLNTIQLSHFNDRNNSLLEASINQKSQELRLVNFAQAINLQGNRKYLKYALPPLVLCLGIALIAPKFFSDSSTRIVQFQNEFAEPAPFEFLINNKSLRAFQNEDFTLNLSLRGSAVPDAVYILSDGRKYKMESADKQHFNYTFSKVQEDFDIQFEAAGFKSNQFEISVAKRPALLAFDVHLNYPAHLQKANESFENVGNLVVPEGTTVRWEFDTDETEALSLKFDNQQAQEADKSLLGGFSFAKRMKTSSAYKIALKNENGTNRENIDFFINVIPDRFPQIQLEQFRDTTLYNFIVVGGNITDDYGFSQLKFYHKISTEKENAKVFTAIDLPFNKTQPSQSFYYQLPLNSLNLKAGDKVEYFVQVWDNDAVNGAKSTKTQVLTFALPDKKELEESIDQSNQKTEEQFEKAVDKAKKLKNELNQLEDRLKTKKDLDFQDKKQIEDLVKKREDLIDDIQKLQEQYQQTQEKQQRFSEKDMETQKKVEQLQKLMQQLLDEETKKLYEELEKLLEKNFDEKTLEQLEKMKNKERNLDKELDRALQLFKQLQFEQKAEKAIDELNKLADKQDKQADKSEQGGDKEQLSKEQDKLSKEFDDLKDSMKDLEKLAEDAKQDMDTDEGSQQDISEDQQNAEKELSEGKNKKGASSQKKAAQKMKKLAQKMESAMESMEMEQQEEDMESLRALLENLLKLSHDQERLMKDFKLMNVSDPRFVKLSQDQLKLQDDAKVIEDSLYALSKRVMQIQGFITKEVTSMKNAMDESVKFIRERKLGMASAKQQFSMTSINNLALMLSDVFSQMQAMMKMSGGDGVGGKKGKKAEKKAGNSLGEMQKQLNKRIDAMKKGEGGQMGRGKMSEELARLAQEQSALRKRIGELQQELKGTELGKKLGNELKELQEKMEETETDLVNRRITQDLIKRQQDITIRLLESEKAIQQQEEDPTREAKTGKQYEQKIPPAFQKYIAEKQKQIELIRTVPPAYTPFYKKETDTYFRKIK